MTLPSASTGLDSAGFTYKPEFTLLYPREKSTYANCELELEWWPFKERGAVIVTASHQPVWPALLDVHAVNDFVVSRDLSHRRATVPQEDSSKPLPNERDHRRKISPGEGQWGAGS